MKKSIMTATCLGLLITGQFLDAATKPKTGDPAKGKQTFEECALCHEANSEARKMGPGLKNLFKKPKLVNGQKTTEDNVRILIEKGGNGMPGFAQQLSADEKSNVIAYLKTL